MSDRDFKSEYYESMIERLNEMRANAESLISDAKKARVDLAKEVQPHLDAIDRQIQTSG